MKTWYRSPACLPDCRRRISTLHPSCKDIFSAKTYCLSYLLQTWRSRVQPILESRSERLNDKKNEITFARYALGSFSLLTLARSNCFDGSGTGPQEQSKANCWARAMVTENLELLKSRKASKFSICAGAWHQTENALCNGDIRHVDMIALVPHMCDSKVTKPNEWEYGCCMW